MTSQIAQWCMLVAIRMEHVYDTDIHIQNRIDSSPEFFRAMIYETGVIPFPADLDGSDLYDYLVEALSKRFS